MSTCGTCKSFHFLYYRGASDAKKRYGDCWFGPLPEWVSTWNENHVREDEGENCDTYVREGGK